MLGMVTIWSAMNMAFLVFIAWQWSRRLNEAAATKDTRRARLSVSMMLFSALLFALQATILIRTWSIYHD